MNKVHRYKRGLVGIIAVALLASSAGVAAGQFRSLSPIKRSGVAPDDYVRVELVRPLNQRLIAHAVNQFATRYRSAELRDFLSERFVNADRFVERIETVLPLDARLRIVFVRRARVLEQFERDLGAGQTELKNTVSAVVSSQLEVSTPEGGLQIFEDTSEWILELTVVEAAFNGGGAQ